MKFLPASLLLLVILCSACHQKEAMPKEADSEERKITTEISLSSFKHTIDLKLSETGINGFYSNLAVIDTFLVCNDFRSPEVLHVYSVNSYRPLRHFITRGEIKGQCLGAANILHNGGNLFWLYDITLGKLLKIDLQKAVKDSSYWGEEEILLREPVTKIKSPWLLTDSTFAGCSYARNDCRYLTFNKKSELIKTLGRLPTAKEEWPVENENSKFSMLASIYTANLVKHPSKDITAVVYNKTDRIELYQKDKLVNVIRGPGMFDPNVQFAEEAGETVVNETQATTYSYTNIFSAGDLLYCLYSGSTNYNTCSNMILVFDWEGNPVKKITTSSVICSFTIGKMGDRQVIFALEKETGNVFMASL